MYFRDGNTRHVGSQSPNFDESSVRAAQILKCSAVAIGAQHRVVASGITIGERALLGANAGIGISIGDDCVVEAGLYVTAGTKVTLDDGQVVKARELSGQDDLLFLRDSVNGAVIARNRRGARVELNSELHAN